MKMTETTKRKGMTAWVYRCAAFGDSTNGGVTAKASSVLLVGEGIPEIFEEREGTPTLVLKTYKGYIFAEPLDAPKGVGWMMGGNYIASSDSRLSAICPYPIPVHDRTESQAQYDALSR